MADIVGRERNGGQALAAYQMTQDCGAIIGPVLAGVLVDTGSYSLAFAATGAISLLAVFPWLRARETLVRTGEDDPVIEELHLKADPAG